MNRRVNCGLRPPRAAGAAHTAPASAAATARRENSRAHGRRLAAFALAFVCAAATAPRAQDVASLAAGGTARSGAKGRAAESRPVGGVRRIASLRSTDGAAGGSRVVVTSDSALDDYTAYREGSRFYVLIPRADASAVASAVSGGTGFTDARVERRGAD